MWLIKMLEIEKADYFEKIRSVARVEAEYHIKALERKMVLTEKMKNEIKVLHLLDKIGWNVDMIKGGTKEIRFRYIALNKGTKNISKEEEEEIKQFYERIDPVEAYRLLKERLDPDNYLSYLLYPEPKIEWLSRKESKRSKLTVMVDEDV
jgi:hypothetical protein